jgi:hypothetical protein
MRTQVQIFQAALVDDDLESTRLMGELTSDQLHELMRVTLLMCGNARNVLLARAHEEDLDPAAVALVRARHAAGENHGQEEAADPADGGHGTTSAPD